MKKLLALALVAVVAVGAQADIIVPEPGDTESNMMGVFFAAPYTEATTNTNVIGSSMPVYCVLLNAGEGTYGYEGGIRGADGIVFGSNAYILGLA
jgi:hypothetical protein